MPPQIVALSGPLAGHAFPLSGASLSFGRTSDNAVVVASPRASRRHAEIRVEGGQPVLYDLGSSNGTLVNGRPVQRHPLQSGDIIQIGDEQFRVELPVTQEQVSPLPPLPASPLPPLPASPPPPSRRSRLPLILAVVGLLSCVLVASLAGGIFVVTRALGGQPGPTSAAGFEGATPAAPQPTRAPDAAGDAARWTVLVYLDGDNNLEPDAIDDFREMARVGSSAELRIVVQLDRISSREEWDDTSAGDWDGTKRFLVEPGMDPDADSAVEDLGELNMGHPDTLADFVAWGVNSYPAERYALIIWDHGASWIGVASDDSSDGDTLSLPELSAALETARERSGYGTFDLIGFDACIMAQLDVFQAIEPYGQVVVASAELEPNQGWAWDVWLAALAADPGQDAAAIAPVIVESYIASFEGTDNDDVTLSAFDLARIGEVSRRLDALSGAMLDGMGDSYSAIGQARSFVDMYVPSYPEEFNAADLGHFARLLPEQGASGPIAAAAADLERAIVAARVANGAGSYHRNSSGISIYFPQVSELYVEEYGRGSPIPRTTRWDEFLQAFHGAGDSAVARPTLGGLQLSADVASTASPVTLTGSVSGDDIAYVFSFIGVPNAARDTVDLIWVDFIYPPGAAPGGELPDWQGGPFDLSLQWDATSWYLSNGAEQIPILLGPVKYGTDSYGVEGVYRSAATGEQADAGMIFDVQGGQGSLQRIWGFPRATGGQEPQPYELIPAAGDSFTAFTRAYTDANGELRPARVEGATIAFGEQPLTASLGPTADGDYVMGFLVRDIAGGFSYDYVDITVDN